MNLIFDFINWNKIAIKLSSSLLIIKFDLYIMNLFNITKEKTIKKNNIKSPLMHF